MLKKYFLLIPFINKKTQRLIPLYSQQLLIKIFKNITYNIFTKKEESKICNFDVKDKQNFSFTKYIKKDDKI